MTGAPADAYVRQREEAAIARLRLACGEFLALAESARVEGWKAHAVPGYVRVLRLPKEQKFATSGPFAGPFSPGVSVDSVDVELEHVAYSVNASAPACAGLGASWYAIGHEPLRHLGDVKRVLARAGVPFVGPLSARWRAAKRLRDVTWCRRVATYCGSLDGTCYHTLGSPASDALALAWCAGLLQRGTLAAKETT